MKYTNKTLYDASWSTISFTLRNNQILQRCRLVWIPLNPYKNHVYEIKSVLRTGFYVTENLSNQQGLTTIDFLLVTRCTFVNYKIKLHSFGNIDYYLLNKRLETLVSYLDWDESQRSRDGFFTVLELIYEKIIIESVSQFRQRPLFSES